MSPIDIFLFFIGVSRLFMFNVGGQLYLTDLLLTASFLFLLLAGRSHRLLLTGPVLLLIGLWTLWFLNAIITDIYRETPFEDWSRGWSMILFFLLDFLGLVLLTELRLARISMFMAGVAFALLIEPSFFPKESLLEFDSAWKFSYAPALTTLAAMAGLTVFSRRLFGAMSEWAPLAVLGVLNLAFDYRSMFGIAMAAVTFGMLKHAIDLRPQLRAKFTPASFAVLIGVGLFFSQGLIAVYATAAENGWLGLDARDKYFAQTSGGLGLLQAGRAEQLVSVQAIADSPIVGHGSWAKDDAYVSILLDILESKGVAPGADYREQRLIPTHSHLTGAWVQAGIMGGVFWLVVMGIAIKALYFTLKRQGAPATFAGFILISIFWEVLFSPFGAEARYATSSQICVALWALGLFPHKVHSVGVEKVGVSL